MNNYSFSPRNNQGFLKIYYSVIYWLGGSTPAFFEPEPIPSVITPLRLRILKEVLRYITANNQAFPSHAVIAKTVGCHINTVLDALKVFEELDLFEVTHRGHQRKSNIYALGKVFKQYGAPHALRFVLSNLQAAVCKFKDRLCRELGLSVERSETQTSRGTANQAVKTQDSILLLNNNVFKKNYSNSSNRERRLYSTPFLKKEDWLNMQKALWADWGLTESNYHMEYKKPLKTNNFYDKQEEPAIIKPASHNAFFDIPSAVTSCMDIMHLPKRLQAFQELYFKVPGASRPYIQLYINKTKKKLEESYEAQSQLPF